MAIKNLIFFGSFDASSPGFLAQSDAFAGVCQKVMLDLTGHDCEIKKTGKPSLRGKSGQPAAVKAHLRAPDGADNDEQLIIGSNMGLAATDPIFFELVKQELRLIADYEALIDLDVNLANAIAQSPPGLIVDGSWTPPPGTVNLSLVKTGQSGPSHFYSLIADEDIEVDGNGVTQLLLPTGVFAPYFYTVLRFEGEGGYLNPPYIRGKLTASYTQTATIDGTDVTSVLSAVADGASFPELTYDGSSVGTQSSRAPTGPIDAVTDLNILYYHGINKVFLTGQHLIPASPFGRRRTSHAASQVMDPATMSVADAVVSVDIENTTGVIVPAGSIVAKMATFSEAADLD